MKVLCAMLMLSEMCCRESCHISIAFSLFDVVASRVVFPLRLLSVCVRRTFLPFFFFAQHPDFIRVSVRMCVIASDDFTHTARSVVLVCSVGRGKLRWVWVRDATATAKIRICRIQILCAKSVGYGCGCGFVA